MSTEEPDPTTDERVHELYGAPLAEFVKHRDALVRELRKAGRRDAATTVAALRRPTPGAWALNQVVRHDEAVIATFLETATAMRDATEQAFAGDARALRAMATREREAVRGVVDAALAELRASGKPATDAVAQKVRNTVRAALGDESLGELVRNGMLTDDLQSTGFGLGDASPFVTATASAPPKRRTPRRTAPTHVADAEDGDTDAATSHERERLERERLEHERIEHERMEQARIARERLEAQADELEAEADRLVHMAAALAEAAEAAEAEARTRRLAADDAEAAAATASAAARRAREAVPPAPVRPVD